MAQTSPKDDLSGLCFEQARDELAQVVQELESGTAALSQSMELWQRGEQLAAHCQQLLDQAQAQVAERLGQE